MFSGEVAGLSRESVATRDAADGLGAIADALDQGFDPLAKTGGGRFWVRDAFAIALGWVLLVAVILYPALQLAAIVLGMLFLGAKPLVRLVLGPPAVQPVFERATSRPDPIYSAA